MRVFRRVSAQSTPAVVGDALRSDASPLTLSPVLRFRKQEKRKSPHNRRRAQNRSNRTPPILPRTPIFSPIRRTPSKKQKKTRYLTFFENQRALFVVPFSIMSITPSGRPRFASRIRVPLEIATGPLAAYSLMEKEK